jgi:hypothetical protein
MFLTLSPTIRRSQEKTLILLAHLESQIQANQGNDILVRQVVEFGRSINIVSLDVMPAVSALVWYLDLLQGFPITLDILESLELIKENKIVFLFDCFEEIRPLKCFCFFAYENNLGNLVLSSIL